MTVSSAKQFAATALRIVAAALIGATVLILGSEAIVAFRGGI